MAVFHAIYILVAILIFQKEVCCQCCGQGKAVTCQRVPELLTSRTGTPLDNNKASLTVGPGGPLVLYDNNLVDKLCAFNRGRIPERIVHANGVGGFGHFVVTNSSFSKYCKTSMFQHVGQKTEFVIRFSPPFLEAGSCDNVRAFRGAGIKFYTCDGNLDLTCLTTPIFGISDPTLFSSAAKIARRDPGSHFFNGTSFWDFVTLRHEMLYFILHIFSSRGMPDGYRHMDFFAGHAFKVVNKWGHVNYAKFHFLTDQGLKGLNSTYAASLCGSDPDYAKRDLFNSIAAGKYPSWTMYYQIMSVEQTKKFRWNPFDLTKIWPEDEYHLHKVGTLMLNRNPADQFTDLELAAFAPSHLVPGLEPSPDKVFQFRLFSYADSQVYRLGANHLQLPVNRAKVRVLNNQRDGAMAMCGNQEDLPSYFPNSYGQHVCPDAAYARYPVNGDVARYNTDYEDNYSQPRTFYRGLPEEEKNTLYENICASASLVLDKLLQARVLAAMKLVDENLALGVQQCLNAA